MTYYLNISDDWVSYRAPAPQQYEAVSTYTPWWYDDYEDEDEGSSLGSPILWGVGGLILGAFLMWLVLFLIRKKTRMNGLIPTPKAPEREDLLKRREMVARSMPGEEPQFSNAVWTQPDASSMKSVESRLAEVRVAEAIPGETLAMLTERVQGCMRRVGVEADIKDAGKIVAAYACNGCVRLAADEGTDPNLLKRASQALSEFFCVSFPGNPEPVADYLPADDSVPLHARTMVKLSRPDKADWQSYGGINREPFLGILREAEEEQYLPEEEWKRVDVLLTHYTGNWFGPARHQVIRNIENTTTCLLAIGVDPNEALDYAIYQALFLRIYRHSGKSGMIVLGEAFNDLFKGREMPLCRNFLAEYMPASGEAETPATKNQTIHGGEYEPV